LDLVEERGVEVDLAVDRAIERAHARLRRAAAAPVGDAAIHDQDRRGVGLPGLAEDVLPLDLGAAEDARDEHPGRVRRRAGPARLLLAGPRPVLLIVAAAAVDHFGAADQQHRVDAERPADQAEHHDGAKPEPATTDRHPETTATAAALLAAAIL